MKEKSNLQESGCLLHSSPENTHVCRLAKAAGSGEGEILDRNELINGCRVFQSRFLCHLIDALANPRQQKHELHVAWCKKQGKENRAYTVCWKTGVGLFLATISVLFRDHPAFKKVRALLTAICIVVHI